MISINLPNFFKNTSLIALKAQMGIDKDTYGDFGDSQRKANQIQLETMGVEVENVTDITPLADHTLTFKGERVILFIRDVNDYNNSGNLPKFHVANCSTLQTMIKNGRKRRYVVSQSESNIFQLNFVNGNSVRKEDHSLSVCKNCLEILCWNDYSKTWITNEKDKCVSFFKISDFFSKYPKSLIDKKGYSNNKALLNKYSDNWDSISHTYRKSKNWICEQCGVNLINNKNLLHTHHINSQKNENSHSNLRALCVCCHANQPMHDHMFNNPNISESVSAILDIRRAQGKI